MVKEREALKACRADRAIRLLDSLLNAPRGTVSFSSVWYLTVLAGSRQ